MIARGRLLSWFRRSRGRCHRRGRLHGYVHAAPASAAATLDARALLACRLHALLLALHAIGRRGQAVDETADRVGIEVVAFLVVQSRCLCVGRRPDGRGQFRRETIVGVIARPTVIGVGRRGRVLLFVIVIIDVDTDIVSVARTRSDRAVDFDEQIFDEIVELIDVGSQLGRLRQRHASVCAFERDGQRNAAVVEFTDTDVAGR